MNKPTLTVLVGLSGSGKSTIATQLTKDNSNTVIVSTDAIREELGDYESQEHNEEVFKIFHDRLRKNLENKKNVIADATNLTMKSRRYILQKIHGLDVNKVCYIIPKTFEQCKIDNKNREHPVPDEVLDKQIRRFQIPFYEEGWDEIQLAPNFMGKPFDLLRKMEGFDQKNPYHFMDLYNHCQYTKRLMYLKGYEMPWTFGALVHDCGKLFTQTFDENGIAHYYNHQSYGSYEILTTKPYDVATLDLCFLVNYHMMPFEWEKATEKTKQRWKDRFGEEKYNLLLDFHECDIERTHIYELSVDDKYMYPYERDE